MGILIKGISIGCIKLPIPNKDTRPLLASYWLKS